MSEYIQKNYYAIIPANVRYDKRLKPLARLLYGEITALCNEKGYCWASNSYFAELYEVNNKTISRAVQQLEECGHIKCVYDKTQQNNDKRKIFIEYRQKCPDGMDKNVQTVWTKMSIPYRQKCPDGMDKNVQHNNTYNNTNNNTASVCETHTHSSGLLNSLGNLSLCLIKQSRHEGKTLKNWIGLKKILRLGGFMLE